MLPFFFFFGRSTLDDIGQSLNNSIMSFFIINVGNCGCIIFFRNFLFVYTYVVGFEYFLRSMLQQQINYIYSKNHFFKMWGLI